MSAQKVTKNNHLPGTGDDRFKVYSKQFNELVDYVNDTVGTPGTVEADIVSEETSGSGVTVDGVLLKDNQVTASGGVSQGTANVIEFTKLVTLSATEIVGTSAGDIGHASGAVLVAAPGAGYALEFVAATLIMDYSTAAYTGGANDAVIRLGTTAVSSALTDTNCFKATADAIVRVGAIATEKVLTANSTINIAGTAFTQPGTAAGVVRVYITYRQIATGL